MQECERLCQWHGAADSFGGIADDDTLVGLADAKGDAEKISEAIKVHIDPIPEFNLSFAKAEDKEFVVLTVMPGAQTPYYYIGDGQMQAFVRVGNESVVASMSKHKELVLKGSNMSYDSLVSRWKFEDMAFTVLRATYFKRTNARLRIATMSRSVSSTRRVN